MGPKDVVDAVQAAEERDLVLSLEVLSLHSTLFILTLTSTHAYQIDLHVLGD